MKYIAVVFVAMIAMSTVAFSATDSVMRTISVSGRGEIMVVPDQAVANLGVESFKSDLDEAKAENDRAVSAVIAAIIKTGVSKEDLKTDYLSIQPRYKETHEERTLLGYLVRKSIVVTANDVDNFEGILSAALEAGANQVHGIEFKTSEPRKHKDDARALALDAAREKAEAMAKQLGQKIGRPISIVEEASGPRAAPFVSNASRLGGGGVRAGEGTMISGRISVSARVSVKFELVE